MGTTPSDITRSYLTRERQWTAMIDTGVYASEEQGYGSKTNTAVLSLSRLFRWCQQDSTPALHRRRAQR